MAEKDMQGRVCVVTGANSGIGRVTALELARRGARVLMACRSVERSQPVLDEVRRESGHDEVELVSLDLASLASVRACAEDLAARPHPVHVLVNNAGLAGHRGATEDGFEVAFGVNHLGHFLLTLMLADKLKDGAPARIVNVASRAHQRARGIDFDAVRRPTRSVSGMSEYGVSKLANVLFTAELVRRLEGTGVVAYALHPGVVASAIWRRMPWPIRPIAKAFMITNEEGAQTTLHCATAPELATQRELYWDRGRPKEPNPLAQEPQLAAELWRRSLEWTGAPDLPHGS
ncbi:MAG: SDR family oxidoreductase [Myxococcota bacterium]